MSAKTIVQVSSWLILPALYVAFYALHVATNGHPIEQWLPKWDRVLLILSIVVLERIYTYRYAVSQRAMLPRDLISNAVNLWVTGVLATMIFLPVLAFFPDYFFGRKLFFASSEQLGPLWLQVPVVLLIVSFARYWIHRAQHEVQFLWELHSYHHRVTDLTAANGLVSHPIDFALRNVLIFVALGVVGFHPFAILLAVSVTLIAAEFSHCGADVKGWLLNYVFVTPEVHRWHHSADVPAGHKYAVNYSVEFPLWDAAFGTFYLPGKGAAPEQPPRIGHPGGLPDEPSYLKLLLAPLGLYRPVSRLKRPEPAE